jgi:hypothetical protein
MFHVIYNHELDYVNAFYFLGLICDYIILMVEFYLEFPSILEVIIKNEHQNPK